MAVITIYSRSARLSKNFSYATHMYLFTEHWYTRKHIRTHREEEEEIKLQRTTPTHASTHTFDFLNKKEHINKIGDTNMANMK